VEVASGESQNRFKFIFQTFFQTISTPAHPVILFLDDLQWADKLSLQLVCALVTNMETSNFLFIGSYRDNEIDINHPLSAELKELQKEASNTNIHVSSLTKENVNELISDTIHMPQELTITFSDIVYKKTGGNALFVTQFLRSLWDEGLLFFSLESKTWKWDIESIKRKEIHDDVGLLMSNKILQLPAECQHAMKLLACVGSSCDETTLSMFMRKEKGMKTKTSGKRARRSAVENKDHFLMLKLAIDEGLLKKEGSSYVFVHDQIQNAAYSLIPEDERGRMHKSIGRLIMKHSPEDKIEDLLFLVVDQLNRGEVGKEERETTGLAKLNLKAGKKAMSEATFLRSASYFEAGVGVLCDGHWEDYYDLSLELHSLLAETQYCNGCFEIVGKIATIVLNNAKSLEDKLPIYIYLIKSLGAQNKHQSAIEIGITAVHELGMQRPSPSPDKLRIMADFIKAKLRFEVITTDDFLAIEEMKERNKLAAMKLLILIAYYAYLSKQEYIPIVLTQMLQLTLQHGICNESCIALANSSYLLLQFKDVAGSKRLAELALLLLKKPQAKKYLPRVYAAVYTGVFCWYNHLKLSETLLWQGYQEGMLIGDIEFAFVNATASLQNRFLYGAQLTLLEKDIELCRKRMVEYGQASQFAICSPLQHAVSKLVYFTGDPLSETDNIIRKKETSELSLTKTNFMLDASIYFYFCIVEYIFGNYDSAADKTEERWIMEKECSRTSKYYGSTAFYDCLICVAMARKSKKEKWVTLAESARSKVKQFAKFGKSNCDHKCLLLQAEILDVEGNVEDASSCYDAAIDAAEKSGFVNEQAIASERAGDFYLRLGDTRSSHYYDKARDLYHQWGALAKADHLYKSTPS